jgi:Bacterial membrane protein YfhO
VTRRLALRVVPCAVLLVEVLVFYRQVLFDRSYAIPWDLRYYHLPQIEFMARAFRNGELPLWDPYTYCGIPIYANLTTQLFYPPTVVTVWLSNLAGGSNLLYFLEWQIVLHVFLGGVLAYLLLRRMGTSLTAALFGGTVFQLGGYFASQTQHLGAMDAAAWMPLAWLSVISLSRGFSWRWTAVLAAGLSMAILAGFPAVTFVVAASTMIVGFLAGWRKTLVPMALGAVWALLLAAVQVLPTAELTRLSVAKYRSDWIGDGGGLPLASLVSLVAPNYYGIFDLSTYTHPWQPTFLYLFCGISGLALALAAVIFRRDRNTRLVGLATAITMLWMLGASTPVGKLAFRLLPNILKSSVYPEFAMAAFVLSVAVLAGLGADRIALFRKPLAGGLLVAVAAAELTAAGSGRPLNTGSLTAEPGLTYSSFDGSTEVLTRVRSLTRRARPPWRIDTIDDSMNWAHGAALTEVPTANGNDPFALIRFMQVRLSVTGGERWGRYYQVSKPVSPVLDLMNVRYLLSRAPLGETQSPGLSPAATIPGRTVYENLDALPRFFFVSRIHHVRGMEEGLSVMRASDFRPAEAAVVEGTVEFQSGTGTPHGSVRVIEYEPRRVTLELESAVQAFLVTSETYYPGWRAFVDGRERPLVLTNVAFRGMPVEAGRHRIEMRFEPAILWRGAVLSAAGWALLVAAFAFGDNGRKRTAGRGTAPSQWTSSSS